MSEENRRTKILGTINTDVVNILQKAVFSVHANVLLLFMNPFTTPINKA